ncbi:MAG: type IV secretory system conjugative DNA transfer family protein [Alphaproteobacteria bacterium]|nr:type IV secretory system conjugative DNA transfer family protein [Alphaproteobacteria bacterium]
MSLNRFTDTLLYRRAKYFAFIVLLTILSLATMGIIILLWNTFGAKYLVSAYTATLGQPSVSQVDGADLGALVVSIIRILYAPPQWLTFVFLLGMFLFILENYKLFALQYFGWAFAALQRFKDAGHFSSGGNARFAGMFEEYQTKKYAGIYYGRSLFNRDWYIFNDDDRHMLTIAGSRSGKGATAIIPNLLRWRGNVLCIDPKGTNTNVTAQRRRNMGQEVFVIDPFNVVPNEEPAHFNPLDIVDPESLTVVEDIRLLSEALIPAEPDEKNTHFTESAKSILDGYIVHVVTSGDYPSPSLIDVYDIINMNNFSEESVEIHAKMSTNKSCGGLAQQTAQRVLESMDTNEFKSVVATLKTNLKWLASEAFKETLTHSSFSFDNMKNSKMSVYLVIPPDMLTTHKRFLRLFVNVASSRFTRGGKAKITTLFIIDEAPALGYMEEIAKAYGELASYNLIMWTFFQDKGQLDHLYGSRAETLIGSSRAVQVFNIRSQDSEWVASMIGTRGAINGNDDNKTTEIKGFRDAGSIEKEIGSKGGLQYILRAGEPALILQRTPYYNTIDFAVFAHPDPDHPTKKTNWTRKQIIASAFEPFHFVLTLPFLLTAALVQFVLYLPFKFVKLTFEGFTDFYKFLVRYRNNPSEGVGRIIIVWLPILGFIIMAMILKSAFGL